MRFILIALSFFALTATAHARSAPDSFADLVEKLSPAVVNISTSQTVQQRQGVPFRFDFRGMPGMENNPFQQFFEQFGNQMGRSIEKEVSSLGSGFVIDPKGYVVTNNHVVENADKVIVTFANEEEYQAEIIGRDKKTDLALLKIDADKKLPYVKLGDSEKLRVGDWVIAIGNPFGLGGSVSAGIVSARSRNINAGPFDDFIQTDAAINRGNSGGPLFDLDGNVVGINTAIFSPSGGNVGIGFAVPTELAQPVLEQLKDHGRTFRGWLGVKIQGVSDEIANSLGLKKAQGALVLEVTPNSPAEEGGLQAGDIIFEFDGEKLDEMRSLPRLVAETKEGTRVKLKIWRNGEHETLRVKLGELAEEEQEVAKAGDGSDEMKNVDSKELLGMELVELDDLLRQRLGLSREVKGLVVAKVDPKSDAQKKGVRVRDVILLANQEEVRDLDDFRAALKQAKKDKKDFILLRISRGGDARFVTLAVE